MSNTTSNHRRYWIARLTSDQYWEYAVKNNLWLMQQRYGFQKPHIVTQLLNLVKKINVGDVLFLAYGDTIYAYGNVVKCPYQTRQISNLQNIVSNKKYDFNDGIVCFEDADAFYEDLREGVENWGQRVSVDQWHYYMPKSNVKTDGCKNALLDGNLQQSVFEVNADYAQNRIKKLERQFSEKYMLISDAVKLTNLPSKRRD